MLSLVIPCYNEQDNVKLLFEEVNKTFAGRVLDYEFVFVNDGSSDNTLAELKKIYNDNKQSKIQVLSFSRNFGKESAMYAGLQKAKGDYVCIIDADLQQKPEVVIEMLEIMSLNPSLDCVTAYQKVRREGKLMKGIKSAFYKFINKATDVKFVDGASDFRLMKRKMVDAVISMGEYHRFSKGLFSWVGFNCEYIPYEVSDRANGKTKWSTKGLMKYALDGLLSFSTLPLHIATYTGVATSIGAILYMIIVILKRIIGGVEIPGYATIVVLVLLIGGIQLFCLGVLGEYMSKMYIQSKDRPIYILKEYLEYDEKVD